MTQGKFVASIAPDGTITVEGINFKGNACSLPPTFFDKLGKVTNSEKKAEYHQQNVQQQQQRA